MVMITETCKVVDARVENVKCIEQPQSELAAERELTGKLVVALRGAYEGEWLKGSQWDILAKEALALVPADRRK